MKSPTLLSHLMFIERWLKLLKKKALMKRDEVVPAVMIMKTRYSQSTDTHSFRTVVLKVWVATQTWVAKT